MKVDWRLHHGECGPVMRGFQENSYEALVTDPPYGLRLLGHEFDRLGDSEAQMLWHRAWAVEALRVLRPGAHLVAFGAPRTYHLLTYGLETAGFEIRDSLMWLYGTGFPKSLNASKAIDAHILTGQSNSTRTSKTEHVPKTAEAQKWKGWGTALKPAFEPIVLARKPFPGSTAENLIEHGLGALNIEMTRAGPGRWPANVVLDEEAAQMLDTATPDLWKSSGGGMKRNGRKKDAVYAVSGHEAVRKVGFGDDGGASRFFYCAKPTDKERGEGNDHPTVKPLALMRWLVRLVTPRGANVLDPFMGSGSTGLAALQEGSGFTGIEREERYVEISRRRLKGGE